MTLWFGAGIHPDDRDFGMYAGTVEDESARMEAAAEAAAEAAWYETYAEDNYVDPAEREDPVEDKLNATFDHYEVRWQERSFGFTNDVTVKTESFSAAETVTRALHHSDNPRMVAMTLGMYEVAQDGTERLCSIYDGKGVTLIPAPMLPPF